MINQGRLSDAYNLAISKGEDLLLIKLMGKTGICLDRVERSIMEYLILKIISILKTKEFVHVLLPWVTELSDILLENKDNHIEILSQNVVAELIEVLINLMNDVKSNIDFV